MHAALIQNECEQSIWLKPVLWIVILKIIIRIRIQRFQKLKSGSESIDFKNHNPDPEPKKIAIQIRIKKRKYPLKPQNIHIIFKDS